MHLISVGGRADKSPLVTPPPPLPRERKKELGDNIKAGDLVVPETKEKKKRIL